jgi:hypothetical protein
MFRKVVFCITFCLILTKPSPFSLNTSHKTEPGYQVPYLTFIFYRQTGRHRVTLSRHDLYKIKETIQQYLKMSLDFLGQVSGVYFFIFATPLCNKKKQFWWIQK